MLEIMGEVVYKAVAYRRVADAIERYPEDVASLYRRGTPPAAGRRPGLSQKLAELSETGSLAYHDKLHAQVPDGLLEILKIPGVGPRTVKLLYEELGIDSVDALRAAAADGQLRGVKASRSGLSRTSWPGSRDSSRRSRVSCCTRRTR